MILYVLLGIGGIAAFFLQAIDHWRSRTPISSKKNLLLRLLWLFAVAILSIALLVSEGLNRGSLLCGGLVYLGIVALVLASGYFIERQYNRVVGKPHGDDSE